MTRIIIPIQKTSIMSGYLLPFMTCLRELELDYIKIDGTAVIDQAGNAYVGITDATTLNFQTTGGANALPTLTAIMLTFSTVIRTYWWLLAGLGFAAITTLSWLYRQETSGRAMDAWLLRVPLVGGLMASYNAARFSSTLALLTGSGVPILKALDTAVATMSNRSLRYALNTNLHKVKEGASIAGALDASQALPDAVVTFTRLGEQTGRLPDMLGRVSRQLSTDVTRKAMSLASILEPLGWTPAPRADSCGCAVWTAPGVHASPKSATAHDTGCTAGRYTETNAPLHIWTDNPAEPFDAWVAENYGESDDVHTVEELKALYQKMLYNTNLQNAIMDDLLANSTFKELPKEVTDYQVNQCLNYYYTMANYYGYDLDSFVQTAAGYENADALLEGMSDSITTYSKEALLYQAVAETLDIVPTQEQIDTYSSYTGTYGENYCTMVALMDAVTDALTESAVVS